MKSSKGSKGLNFEWNYTQLKFKPETVEKNGSTISPPAGIEPTHLRCRCNALATGSIPVGGPIVDQFFSTVPGLNLRCVEFEIKTL